MSFTHLDESGHARMVDVTGKQPTVRAASARAFVTMAPDTVAALRDGSVPKGDVLAVSRIAGIQAAKRTPELLPLAHVIGVHGVVVDLQIEDAGVSITATVRTADRTGVEMEALTAVTVAALSVVDMVKGIDRTVTITDACTERASGCGSYIEYFREGHVERLHSEFAFFRKCQELDSVFFLRWGHGGEEFFQKFRKRNNFIPWSKKLRNRNFAPAARKHMRNFYSGGMVGKL